MNHIPEIRIRLIKHSNQRVKEEVGDWFYDAELDRITVFVSRMSDFRSELAVALHEAYESVAYLSSGKDQTDVDFFDKKFYMENKTGEAGDSIHAPYRNEHIAATFIEKDVCDQLELDWPLHEQNVNETH